MIIAYFYSCYESIIIRRVYTVKVASSFEDTLVGQEEQENDDVKVEGIECLTLNRGEKNRHLYSYVTYSKGGEKMMKNSNG